MSVLSDIPRGLQGRCCITRKIPDEGEDSARPQDPLGLGIEGVEVEPVCGLEGCDQVNAAIAEREAVCATDSIKKSTWPLFVWLINGGMFLMSLLPTLPVILPVRYIFELFPLLLQVGPGDLDLRRAYVKSDNFGIGRSRKVGADGEGALTSSAPNVQNKLTVLQITWPNIGVRFLCFGSLIWQAHLIFRPSLHYFTSGLRYPNICLISSSGGLGLDFKYS